jgi:hypothetical protein
MFIRLLMALEIRGFGDLSYTHLSCGCQIAHFVDFIEGPGAAILHEILPITPLRFSVFSLTGARRLHDERR